MPQDDSGDLSPTRAALQARIRELEKKRDEIQERIASQRRDNERDEGSTARAEPGALLRILDEMLPTVEPTIGTMTNARSTLLAELAEAERRNDTAALHEIGTMLGFLDAHIAELRTGFDRLKAIADTMRNSIGSDPGGPAKTE